MTAYFTDQNIPYELAPKLEAHAKGVTVPELSDAQKLDYIYRNMKALESLVAQAGPLLEQAGPLLATFAGQASSPMGRILGGLIR